MIPRFGPAAQADRRYTRRPGAYAILPRDGQILTTWQGGIHNEVQLPGGGIDPGESARQALAREVIEETGWRIGPARRIGTYRRFVFMPEYDLWAEKICAIFVARPLRPIGPPTEADHQPLWLPAQDAIGLLASPGDAAFLAQYCG